MPQIPGVNYGGRPDGQVPQGGEMLPIDGGAKALEIGARTVEDFADARQKALDQKRGIVTDVAAIKAASDYSLATGDVAATFQQKYASDPFNPKLRAEFADALQQNANTAAAAISDEDTRYKTLTRLATINSHAQAQMEDWADRQSTTQTKGVVEELKRKGTGAAANAPSPNVLEQMLPTAKSDLGKMFAQVTPDGGVKMLQETRQNMVIAWAETQSANPYGAFAVLAALSDPKGVVQRTLADKPDEIARLTQKATKSFEGGGVTAMLNALAAAHKDISNVLSLAVANDPKFMSASLAVRDKISQDIEATKANTDHIPADARKARLQTLQTNAAIIDTLDNLYRAHPGVFQGKADPKITADIVVRSKELWEKPDEGSGDYLKRVLELRRDAVLAFQAGTMARQAYETLETKAQLMIPKSQAAQDTGYAKTIRGHDIGILSPIQAGNRRMKDLLDEKGPYGTLSQEKKNNAWLAFFDKMNASHQGKAGAASPTNENFRQMALDAVEAAAR